MWPARATVGRQPSRCVRNLGGFFHVAITALVFKRSPQLERISLRLSQFASPTRRRAMTVLQFPHLSAISSLPKGLLYPHQSDGVAFLISKGRAILGDDMGL